LAHALQAGARETVRRVDLTTPRGSHPHVGALDVAPVVFLEPEHRGAACAEALLTADLLAELGLPVFLYGLLAGGRGRAELRKGGLAGLTRRATRPDFGPALLRERSGAVLVAARPPLVAFNFELRSGTVQQAKAIAARIREGGADGLPGVRALGLEIRGTVAQVSTNVEDHRATPLVAVLNAIERHADVAEAELIGVPPRAAFDGWPDRVPVRNRRCLEDG
jgi:glutamate formiminotransferase/glutamate formiminotransferase/formiminotetrahydrofolate cyclodeaminase